MTSKTKYIVIVLLLVVLATTSVGLSTWNIHYQANVGIIDFTATTPGTQESILNRYVYFEGAQEHTTVDENGNTVTSTKISYPIGLDTTEEIFTYVYDGNTHSPTVFVPIEENSKGDENHPTNLFLDDGELNDAWGITDVFDEIKFKYQYRLIAMPFVAKDYKGNSDNYCEVHSVTYGVDTNDDNIGDSITVCISWKNGKKGNNQGENVLVVIPLSANKEDVQIIIGDQSYSLNDTTNTTANKISVSFDGNTASVGVKGFNSYSFSMENNGWTETAPSNAGVYQCRITAVVNSETDTSADTDEHKNAANEAIEVLNALTESDISYAAQVTYAILPYDVTMDNLTTDSFSYSQAAQSYALLSTVAETDSTDSTSGLTKINNNDNSFYVTYGGIGFEITITSNFTTLNGSTPTVSFPIGEYLFSDANALTALLTDNWSEEENHYYTTYGFSPDPNYQITNPVVHYTILRREVEIDNWTTTELVYNGTAQSQTASATNSYDAEFTYSYTDANGNALESTPVNAGTYTVWASAGSNYYLSCSLEGIKTQTNDADEVTKIGWEYTIAPKTVTITWGDTEFTYDGNSHAPTATVASSELCSQNGVLDSCTVTVTGAQTNASTTAYTATATLDNGNYTATNATQAFTINPKPITKPAENTSTFTYDGSTQTYTLATNSAYTISDNVQTNADEYTVTVSLNDTTNYVWADDSTADVIFTFTIAPASVTVIINNATITYGQNPPTYTYTATGLFGDDTLGATATCSYTKGNNADTYEITLDQTNVNTNYNITSVTNGTLTVQKASVTVVIDSATITYGQNPPTYTYTATGLLGTDTLGATAICSYTAGNNAGTYNITLDQTNINSNYTISSVTNGTLTVTKISVEKPDEDTTTYVYTGVAQTYTLATNSAYTISNNVQTNADEYTVTVSLKDTTNYQWSDGTTDNLTYTFTIAKAENEITWNDDSLNADGTLVGWAIGNAPVTHSATAIVGTVTITYYTTYDSTTGTCSGEFTPSSDTAVGTYYAMASVDETSNYLATSSVMTFSIVEPSIENATVTLGTTTLTYNGAEQTLGKGTDIVVTLASGAVLAPEYYTLTYTLVGTTDALSAMTNAGTYTVTITATSPYSGDVTTTNTITVEKASLTITADSFTVTYGDEVPTYTATFSGLVGSDTATTDGLFEGALTFTCSYAQGTKAGTSCAIVVSGLTSTNYDITYANGSVSVVKQKIYIIDDLLEYYYGQTTLDDGTTAVTPTAIITNAQNNVSISYGTVSNVVTITYTNGETHYTASNTTISVGNTYLINYTIKDTTNYEWASGSATSCYYKYKTVKISDTYYTVEDAIKTGGNIVLAAGKTSFTALDYYKNFDNPSQYYTVASGTNLFVPHSADATYDGTDTYYTDYVNLFSLDGSGSVYSILYIPSAVETLTVNGSFGIGGSMAQGGKVGARGVVMNEATITVYGKLHSIGYLKSATGSGQVVANSSAKLLDILTAYDYKGGRNTLGVNELIFPFNAYSVHNISCDTIIYTGASYIAKFYVDITFVGDVVKDVPIIGTNSLFSLTSGFIKKSTSDANLESWSYKGKLTSVDGSNQIAGQKDIVTICGVAADNSIQIKQTTSYLGFTVGIDITTGPDYPLPISFMDIHVGDETHVGNFSIQEVSYNFLPGTKLEVAKNSTLTVASDITIYFYTTEQCDLDFGEKFVHTSNGTEDSTSYRFNKICVDYVNAELVVNGTANINGNIGGTITTQNSAGVITIANPTVSVEYLATLTYTNTSLLGSDATTAFSTYNAVGPIVNDATGGYATSNFSAGTYYSTGSAWYTSGSYTLTYDMNYDGSISESITKAKGTAISATDTSKLPTRAGYKFDGWYLDAECTISIDTTQLYYGNVTLYAKWTANTYTVTFYPNGGAVDTASKTVTYDSTYGTLPEATRTGYTFAGWWTSASGGTQVTETTTVAITSAQTLYAHWTANTYTITLNHNYGDSPVEEAKQIAYGTAYSTVLTTPTAPNGYEFVGWFTEEVDGEQIDGTTLYTLTTDQTLWAHWNKLDVYVLVTYLDESGNTLATDVQTGIGATYSYSYTITGYTFTWVDESGSTTVPADATSGTPIKVSPSNKIAITYTVVYDTQGGTEVASHTATYDEAFTLPTSTKTGYTLQWLVNGAEYAPSASVSNLTAQNNATVTVVAEWTPIIYKVAFDSNGATSGSMANQELTYDVPKALSVNNFERTGYTFAGWSTTMDGAVEYTDGESVVNLTTTAGNITLYAVWTANTYHVTFVYNDSSGNSVTSSRDMTFDTAYGSPPATPSGYSFAGWYTTSNFVTQVTTVSQDSAHTVYAKYTRAVTFNVNAPSGMVGTPTYTATEIVFGSTLPELSSTSHNFLGWSNTSSGSALGNTVDVDTWGNVTTLYGVWSIKTFTVTITIGSDVDSWSISNGSTVLASNSDVKSSITVDYGTTLTISCKSATSWKDWSSNCEIIINSSSSKGTSATHTVTSSTTITINNSKT